MEASQDGVTVDNCLCGRRLGIPFLPCTVPIKTPKVPKVSVGKGILKLRSHDTLYKESLLYLETNQFR